MIVAEQKPLPEIQKMLKGKKKVLAVGCGTCVSVCFSGGQKETRGLASALNTAACCIRTRALALSPSLASS